MSRLQLWILLLTGTSFLAGLAGGVLLATELRPPAPAPGPFADYETLLVRTFDLDVDRARGLHVILDQYNRQIENIKARNVASMEPELAKLGLTFRNRIRNTVLPSNRRAEFDFLASGRFPASAADSPR